MFVVNTTSATVGLAASRSRPRKRVPSSRRRNPVREPAGPLAITAAASVESRQVPAAESRERLREGSALGSHRERPSPAPSEQRPADPARNARPPHAKTSATERNQTGEKHRRDTSSIS